MPARDASPASAAPPHVPAVALLFALGGCAALIYEVVWFQMLPLVVGSSALSLGLLLGTFMGGLCLGSALAPRWVPVSAHPFRAYAVLEAGIGLLGLALLWTMPLVSLAYESVGGGHAAIRSIVAILCLLPPTILMGATLPTAARWAGTTPRGVNALSVCYAANIGGAVTGSLVAGFYLLRFYDTAVATYVASAFNLVAAATAWMLAQRTDAARADVRNRPARATTPASARLVYVAMALSGLTALASQVVWTRLLSLLFGATTYTFSLILAVFLLGLGIGTGAGAAMARRTDDPGALLGWAQFSVAGAMGWAAWLLTSSLPYWPIDPALAATSSIVMQLDFFRCVLVVWPAAFLWGASFPLALAAVAGTGADAGRMVGRLYAVNTLGAIAGSIGASIVLIPQLGSQISMQVLVGIAAIAALLLLAPRVGQSSGSARRRIAGLVVATVGAAIVAFAVSPVPGLLVAYGRYSAPWQGLTRIVRVGEGLHAFVAVSQASDGSLTYHSAGKTQASTLPEDMRLQRMLGHLSHLVPANPRNVLVIGYGAGITAGALAIAPGVERITIAEIEAIVPETVSPYFAIFNHHLADNPKVTVRIDDDGLESGQNYMIGCPQALFDFAIARNIRMGSGRNLQLRVDVYNAFNTVFYTGRNTTMNLTSPTDPLTITNPQYDLTTGEVIATRLLPNNAGFGAVTGAAALRSVQGWIRFSF